ncbi:MAG: macrolide ABC transporter ATP-binding protein [Verrucomicrobia bacterium]|nr:MAG: macrolide ABC transporter ATP-binding protein [Verrucomicrobiota bacterium]
MLDLQDIVKNYYLGPVTVQALKGINFKVYEKEFVAIVGTSGCGKSTLMNIMGLLDKQTSGNFYIDGIDAQQADDNELSTLRNQKIGFVFQSYNLLPKLNVLENVAVPLLYRGWPNSKIVPRCREMLARVNMADREHHKPNELSGGQQQRVAIARALVGKPSMILADEPTGALDMKTSEDILNLFYELNHADGMTIVLITHNDEIAQQSPRRVLLKDGIVAGDIKKS